MYLSDCINWASIKEKKMRWEGRATGAHKKWKLLLGPGHQAFFDSISACILSFLSSTMANRLQYCDFHKKAKEREGTFDFVTFFHLCHVKRCHVKGAKMKAGRVTSVFGSFFQFYSLFRVLTSNGEAEKKKKLSAKEPRQRQRMTECILLTHHLTEYSLIALGDTSTTQV